MSFLFLKSNLSDELKATSISDRIATEIINSEANSNADTEIINSEANSNADTQIINAAENSTANVDLIKNNSSDSLRETVNDVIDLINAKADSFDGSGANNKSKLADNVEAPNKQRRSSTGLIESKLTAKQVRDVRAARIRKLVLSNCSTNFSLPDVPFSSPTVIIRKGLGLMGFSPSSIEALDDNAGAKPAIRGNQKNEDSNSRASPFGNFDIAGSNNNGSTVSQANKKKSSDMRNGATVLKGKKKKRLVSNADSIDNVSEGFENSCDATVSKDKKKKSVYSKADSINNDETTVAGSDKKTSGDATVSKGKKKNRVVYNSDSNNNGDTIGSEGLEESGDATVSKSKKKNRLVSNTDSNNSGDSTVSERKKKKSGDATVSKGKKKKSLYSDADSNNNDGTTVSGLEENKNSDAIVSKGKKKKSLYSNADSINNDDTTVSGRQAKKSGEATVSKGKKKKSLYSDADSHKNDGTTVSGREKKKSGDATVSKGKKNKSLYSDADSNNNDGTTVPGRQEKKSGDATVTKSKKKKSLCSNTDSGRSGGETVHNPKKNKNDGTVVGGGKTGGSVCAPATRKGNHVGDSRKPVFNVSTIEKGDNSENSSRSSALASKHLNVPASSSKIQISKPSKINADDNKATVGGYNRSGLLLKPNVINQRRKTAISIFDDKLKTAVAHSKEQRQGSKAFGNNRDTRRHIIHQIRRKTIVPKPPSTMFGGFLSLASRRMKSNNDGLKSLDSRPENLDSSHWNNEQAVSSENQLIRDATASSESKLITHATVSSEIQFMGDATISSETNLIRDATFSSEIQLMGDASFSSVIRSMDDSSAIDLNRTESKMLGIENEEANTSNIKNNNRLDSGICSEADENDCTVVFADELNEYDYAEPYLFMRSSEHDLSSLPSGSPVRSSSSLAAESSDPIAAGFTPLKRIDSDEIQLYKYNTHSTYSVGDLMKHLNIRSVAEMDSTYSARYFPSPPFYYVSNAPLTVVAHPDTIAYPHNPVPPSKQVSFKRTGRNKRHNYNNTRNLNDSNEFFLLGRQNNVNTFPTTLPQYSMCSSS